LPSRQRAACLTTIGNFSYNFLGTEVRRLINQVRGINRVVYDITSEPPGHRVGVGRRLEECRLAHAD